MDREWDVAEVAGKAEVQVEAEWEVPSPEVREATAYVRHAVMRFHILQVPHACRSNARNAERR